MAIDKFNKHQKVKKAWKKSHNKYMLHSNEQSLLEIPKKFDRHTVHAVSKEQLQAEEKAIQEFRSNKNICSYCGKEIADMSLALPDKDTELPVHFDCVLDKLAKEEKLSENEKIAYIGQGRFALIHFEDSKFLNRFNIKKIIKWNIDGTKPVWCKSIAELFSQIH